MGLYLKSALGVLCLVLPSRAAVVSPDLGLLQEENRIKDDSELKIQRDILDPILGKDKAKPFVDVEMEVKLTRDDNTRSGAGLSERYKEKLGSDKSAGPQTTDILPGIPKPKTIAANTAAPPERPESVRAMQSQQVRGIEESIYNAMPTFKKFEVTIIHDEGVLKTNDPLRKRITESIVSAMSQYKITDQNVHFDPIPYFQAKLDKGNWRNDLLKPENYLELLKDLIYLLLLGLLFLLLVFLFGPFAKFLKKYVEAIKEKPAAEVNVESKIEPPEEEEEKGGVPGLEEGKLDISFQRKPDELPPPPPPEEDEAMKKFEPFSYINEENVKRLAYMFMLRKEEPWVMAVVISYLRPDYAKALLSSLPLDMQAKLALAALTVRQVTREQVIAIDDDVRESVEFVVGGMERLTTMLDEADTATRANVLNYLKNEKPNIYELVRKFILSFDDIANFPDRDMQVIVRELKTEAMARALQNAAPEVVNKFFANMSAGAASLLKESMEYIRGLSPAQIEEERGKIMEEVKKLEKEGKVSVREKPQGAIDLSELQEDAGAEKRFATVQKKPAAAVPAPAAGDPAQAQSYFEAGVSAYQSGQKDQALQYFEYALTQDPGLWQAHQYAGNILAEAGRTAEALAHFEKVLEINPDPQIKAYVDGLKAQVGA